MNHPPISHDTFAPRLSQAPPRRLLAVLTLGLGVAAAASPTTAFGQAAPQGAAIVAGSGTITQGPSATTINTTSNRTIIEYSSFNIASGQSVVFNQPSANSAVLNRVTGSGASLIQGTLTSNGQVYIVNPAGVTFSSTAVVNVGRLVAAGANLSNADFLNNVQHFTDAAGDVTNASLNLFGDQGVTLVGRNVTNTGGISSANGTIVIVSGQDVLIQEAPGDQILIKTTGFGFQKDSVSRVTNTGEIDAGDNGQVLLGAGDLLGLMVLREGRINAERVTLDTGDLPLELSFSSSMLLTIDPDAAITINTGELSYFCEVAPNDRLSLNAPGGFISFGNAAADCGPATVNGPLVPVVPGAPAPGVAFIDAYARFLPVDPLAVSGYNPIKIDAAQIAAIESKLGFDVKGQGAQPLDEYFVSASVFNDLQTSPGNGRSRLSADRLNYVDAQAALDAYDKVFSAAAPSDTSANGAATAAPRNLTPQDQTQAVRSLIQQATDRYRADAGADDLEPTEFVEWLKKQDPEALEALAGLDHLVHHAMPNLGLGEVELEGFKQSTYSKIAPQGVDLQVLDELVAAAGRG